MTTNKEENAVVVSFFLSSVLLLLHYRQTTLFVCYYDEAPTPSRLPHKEAVHTLPRASPWDTSALHCHLVFILQRAKSRQAPVTEGK